MTRSEAVESYEEPEPTSHLVLLERDGRGIRVEVLEFADCEMQAVCTAWSDSREHVDLTPAEDDAAFAAVMRGDSW